MILKIKNRGEGKTTDLIKLSAETGYRIITPFNSAYVKHQADKLGIDIPTPIEPRHLSLIQFRNDKTPLLVDELDSVLDTFLHRPIYAATLPNENTSLQFGSSISYSNTITDASIKDVIYNNPATIVKWKDGTKTVVKCQPNDTYNPELGLAMCIIKKTSGNKGNYNDVFNKWLPKESI